LPAATEHHDKTNTQPDPYANIRTQAESHTRKHKDINLSGVRRSRHLILGPLMLPPIPV